MAARSIVRKRLWNRKGQAVLALLCFKLVDIIFFAGAGGAAVSFDLYGGDESATNNERRILPEFVNCSVVPRSQSPKNLEFLANDHVETSKPCALLFFGLAKQFRKTVLPSIQHRILGVSNNSRCDIYLHNYNLTYTTNPRNGEMNVTVDPNEVYDLTDNVIMDTNEDFLAARNMTYYTQEGMMPTRKAFTWLPVSLVNMYKQWHSIERVWDLMREAERRQGIEYERVGFFRSDVRFVTSIDIFDGDAVIPNFGWVNDRMFYGTYENAYIWAKIRFPSVPCYVPAKADVGMNSEFFMRDLVLKNIPNVTTRNICFYRVRATGYVQNGDCGSISII